MLTKFVVFFLIILMFPFLEPKWSELIVGQSVIDFVLLVQKYKMKTNSKNYEYAKASEVYSRRYI